MEPPIKKKLDVFFSRYNKHAYKKGELLIHADNQPTGILYLVKGMVKQYAVSSNGTEHILTIYKPSSFFPIIWAINNTKNTHYFEAMEDVVVWIAPKEAVISFLQTEHDVLYDLLKRFSTGMSGMLTRIEYLQGASAYKKVIFTILQTASRFGKKTINTSGVLLRTTHKEIAGFSGLTKETISRESTKLQAKGLIENHNHSIFIKDVKKLEEELTQ